jgi:hypothetical protein
VPIGLATNKHLISACACAGNLLISAKSNVGVAQAWSGPGSGGVAAISRAAAEVSAQKAVDHAVGPEGSFAFFGYHTAGGGCGDESVVVAFVLLGVGRREVGNGTVEDI